MSQNPQWDQSVFSWDSSCIVSLFLSMHVVYLYVYVSMCESPSFFDMLDGIDSAGLVPGP